MNSAVVTDQKGKIKLKFLKPNPYYISCVNSNNVEYLPTNFLTEM